MNTKQKESVKKNWGTDPSSAQELTPYNSKLHRYMEPDQTMLQHGTDNASQTHIRTTQKKACLQYDREYTIGQYIKPFI